MPAGHKLQGENMKKGHIKPPALNRGRKEGKPYSTVNTYLVAEVITSPAFRVVVGNSGWLGLSG